jgi:SAM-dependent methyltransferase
MSGELPEGRIDMRGVTSWRRQPPIDPAIRRAFLDARRRSSQERFDALHAPTYDRDWGAISPSHEAMVRRLMDVTRERGTVLDAACGTGKYWPLVLGSGRTVVGVDQSAGMLRVAAEKHPEVPVARVSLHEIPFDALFDAVMGIDAMEYVGPEDWPVVLARLREAARPGAYLYLTVELLDEDEVRRDFERARSLGEPVVPGESFDGVGYHHYPEPAAIHRWLDDAGLERIDEGDADEYRHLLLRRP